MPLVSDYPPPSRQLGVMGRKAGERGAEDVSRQRLGVRTAKGLLPVATSKAYREEKPAMTPHKPPSQTRQRPPNAWLGSATAATPG